MSIFERTKETATEKGLSLRELEQKAGLGEKSIYSWKKYTPRGTNIQKVADVLGVSVDYLLGNTDEKRPSKQHDATLDLREVSDDERYDMVSAGGRPITDEDWAVIKAILAKYPKNADEG
ncbi:helix-turn-helix domain-containing protein [Weissella viridescens]|uniref:helix-turn-helix domain-containing protein n=1 Tax=Weissella viridescens TaxID=1629 RepID=UPI003AF1E342